MVEQADKDIEPAIRPVDWPVSLPEMGQIDFVCFSLEARQKRMIMP
jgi:hypothetical protein